MSGGGGGGGGGGSGACSSELNEPMMFLLFVCLLLLIPLLKCAYNVTVMEGLGCGQRKKSERLLLLVKLYAA